MHITKNLADIQYEGLGDRCVSKCFAQEGSFNNGRSCRVQWHLRWWMLWVKNVSFVHASWNWSIPNGAQVDGMRKPFKNMLQDAALILMAGVASLLHAGNKSCVRVCFLRAKGPYWVRLVVTSVHKKWFLSQEGTLQTLLGTGSSSPLQGTWSPWHGEWVSCQLRNAYDWGGLDGSNGKSVLFSMQETHRQRI